ncbi:MAG TPA: hydrogenase maturation protease [Streptosporangiaceae bacterium]|nr:hydrogenase maturation protease [Streptosporangiaceae bacterium]
MAGRGMSAGGSEASASGKLLIAGVGNIFLGDDGFGVEVATRLAAAELPDWVHVVDYGIRGMHLAYDLADGYNSAILVDAMARGGEPGTIYVIEPDRASVPAESGAGLAANPLFNAHGMQPDVVLGMLGLLDAGDRQVLVVGCEPACVDPGIGLSDTVAAAVDKAVLVVLDLVAGAAGSDEHLLATKEWAHVPRDSR